jgi:hypothetical protein
MIAKRIRHLGICDHAQTPYQRRKCRAAKLAAAEAARLARIAELGMSEADVIDWYSEATDHVAMLDGDGRDRHATYWQGELAAARQAMTDLRLTATRPRRFGRRAA